MANLYTGEPWTLEYGGVLLGGTSPVVVQEVTGLLDAPDVRTSDQTLLQRNGVAAGTDYLGGRIIHLSLTVLDSPGTLADLLAVFQPTTGDKPFRFSVPGVAGDRARLTARVRKRSVPVNSAFAFGAVSFDVELFAADPLLYEDTESTSKLLPTAPRGSVAIFPMKLPFGFMKAGAVFVSQPAELAVKGNTPTWPVFTVTGPVVNPVILNRRTGEKLTVQLTVPTSEVLVIDTRARSVTLNGASRYGALSTDSVWFPLRPGGNLLEFDDLQGIKTRFAEVRWRSAWL
ncbi:phage tail family protein [Kitasatospora sp. YST-16]|uniref:phage distal tail protein n=1 Tax=Kitasatospora sp. YST-16 TaxID=2998080 RepID=UPI0022838185|nr:phage tail domain-containing protein [Kitasatospora sp. YST-16]WAL73113.1 phage tail family protein [Kitasatospora sp. YST-16]WNW39167.1 phage tail family protein [Streptomyces sp. Li-HN-5-13]